MADDRADLTPGQVLLNAALALNEAVYELTSLAQLKPAQLDHLLVTACMAASDGEAGPYDAALDKIAEALGELGYVYQSKDAAPLMDAAAAWLRGESPVQ